MSTEPQDGSREKVIEAFLMERYGPLLGRDELAKVLGFPSTDAFDRYVQRGHLALKLVRLPKRRGVFALGSDVAAYLVSSSGEGVAAEPKPEQRGER